MDKGYKMKKYINKLLLISALIISFGAHAADNWKYEMPINENVKVPTVKYTDEKHDFNTWISNVQGTVKPVVERQFMTLYNNSPAMQIDADRMDIAANRLKEKRLAEVWDSIIKNYPESKNARSAFCRYGKEIGVFSANVKKCDKDFQLDPATQFVYEPKIKVLKAPHLE